MFESGQKNDLKSSLRVIIHGSIVHRICLLSIHVYGTLPLAPLTREIPFNLLRPGSPTLLGLLSTTLQHSLSHTCRLTWPRGYQIGYLLSDFNFSGRRKCRSSSLMQTTILEMLISFPSMALSYCQSIRSGVPSLFDHAKTFYGGKNFDPRKTGHSSVRPSDESH